MLAAAVEAEIGRLQGQAATLRRMRETLLSIAWKGKTITLPSSPPLSL